MFTTEQSILTLTARDVMKSPVVTIPRELSLRAAADLFQKEQISGAPVIDAEGRCVGVLSTTDFLKWAQQGGSTEQVCCTAHPEFSSDWQVIDVEKLPGDDVRQHMSTNVVSCSLDEPVTRLARLMLDAHIHRIFVLDSYRRPVGVVTSTDILAAVAGLDTPI
ncbi:hypothetical protein AYO44_04615 [Planctomycetaceae bacterium SCGC AG-212-F19]|nr:hypothetical protein AYO44_04615 [Planctomycetaceae bacterium SCGC AG-212-F19]